MHEGKWDLNKTLGKKKKKLGHRPSSERTWQPIWELKDSTGGACICFVLGNNGILKACDLMQHLLPSDGSGIDPHATRLVVRPVTQTGQRRAENGDGG